MPTVIIRSGLARIGAWLALAPTVWLVGGIWVSRGPQAALVAAGCGLLLLVAVWCLWWAPVLVLRESALEVRNAWRHHTISWDAFERCAASWTLQLILRDSTVVTVNAAQRPGGLAASWRRHQELHRGEADSDSVRHQEAVRQDLLVPGPRDRRASLDAASAAALVTAYSERRLLRRQLEAAAVDGPQAEYLRKWNLGPLLAVLVGALLILVGELT
ncbi:hypothetical protein [Actinomyces bovis]|uniref:hypothetical protein n=1 Tax=Actinomyces bovis TaxID=1658 RepID=UPI000F845670|nr:hypothetical protein [Actinomyces bovis]